MSFSQVKWICSECDYVPSAHRKYCTECHSMLTWICTGSSRSGLYKNYFRHRDNCSFCKPEREEQKQHEMEEKQQQLRALDDSK